MPVEGALPLEGDYLLENHSHMTFAEERMGQLYVYSYVVKELCK